MFVIVICLVLFYVYLDHLLCVLMVYGMSVVVKNENLTEHQHIF